MTKEVIISVMSADRVGIIAQVARALESLDGNITELSQTVMRNYFTIILAVTLPKDVSNDDVREAIERMGKPGELAVSIKDYVAPKSSPSVGQRYILTARGGDRKGIISKVAGYLAHKGINIEDCYAYVENENFVMVLQVAIPDKWDINQLQFDLESLGSEIGLSAHLQHENIFLATNELYCVRSISGGSNAQNR